MISEFFSRLQLPVAPKNHLQVEWCRWWDIVTVSRGKDTETCSFLDPLELKQLGYFVDRPHCTQPAQRPLAPCAGSSRQLTNAENKALVDAIRELFDTWRVQPTCARVSCRSVQSKMVSTQENIGISMTLSWQLHLVSGQVGRNFDLSSGTRVYHTQCATRGHTCSPHCEV